MRTAVEILKEKFPNASHLDWFIPIRDCINEARIETIKKCAEVATVTLDVDYTECEVNKQSILNLIEQVK